MSAYNWEVSKEGALYQLNPFLMLFVDRLDILGVFVTSYLPYGGLFACAAMPRVGQLIPWDTCYAQGIRHSL